MKGRLFAALLAIAAGTVAIWGAHPGEARHNKKRVLILTETNGFRHSSIQTAVDTVTKLGDQTGAWQVVGRAEKPDEVRSAISERGLRNVDMVFFANTTGTLDFTPEGRRYFYNWISSGGAYAGVHSASDTFHGDEAYLDLIRGEFQTHGAQQTVEVFVQDPKHPACRGLPASFKIHDEIYEFKNWYGGDVHVLLSMHKHPQRDEKGDYPVAWTNRYGAGRMFYTSLGHREDVYTNELYLKHLTGGIEWALGLRKGSDRKGNPIL